MEEKERSKSRAWAEYLILAVLVLALIWAVCWDPDESASGVPGPSDQPEHPDRKDEGASAVDQAPEVPLLPFIRVEEGLPDRGEWRGDPAAGDLNNDGLTDFVASLRKSVEKISEEPDRKGDKSDPPALQWEYENGLHVFLNNGKGGWRIANEGIPAQLGYGGVEIADFNLDGNPDLAFSTHYRGRMGVFLGDGRGSWTDASEGIDDEAVICDLTAADFTGDGLPDLIGIGQFSENGGLYGFRNMGDGSWTPLFEEPLLGPRVQGNDIASEDVDLDGDADFAVCCREGLKVFLNDGAGGFADCSAGLPGPETRNHLTVVDFGDLDGDGKIELVAGAWWAEDLPVPGISVFKQVDPDEESGLQWKQIFKGSFPGDSIWSLALGDMDGDGDLDLVTSSYHLERGGCLRVYDNAGDGVMKVKGRIEGGSGKAQIELADFNADGKPDVLEVVLLPRPGVRIYLQP